MANSKQIAGLLGPTFVALAITESINLDIWTNVPAPFVYFNGTLLFVAGLSIVRAHNDWKRDWTVLITLTGWLLVLGGLARMLAPGLVQQRTEQHTTAVYALLIVLFALGIFLTFKAYGRENSKTAVQAGK